MGKKEGLKGEFFWGQWRVEGLAAIIFAEKRLGMRI